MLPVLEIRREGQRVKVLFYSTETQGAFVPAPVHGLSPLSRTQMWEVCREAERILESAIVLRTDEEHNLALRGLTEKVAAILPPEIRRLLSARAKQGGPLLIRFHGRLFALPLELAALDNGQLLGEAFDVGVQVVGGNRSPREPRPLRPGQPVRVLIVANTNLRFARKELEELEAELSSHGKDKVQVIPLRDPTRAELEAALENCDVLHVASHATLGDSLKNSGWLLGHGELWRVMDVAACRAAHWPVFVFANLCAREFLTGRVGRLAWRAMARQFVQQGVAHFLGTHVRIPEGEHVKNFALEFYKPLLKNGHGIGAAVRVSRERVSRDPVGRLISSSYCLYGDPSVRLGDTVASLGQIQNFARPLDLLVQVGQEPSAIHSALAGSVEVVATAGFGVHLHEDTERWLRLFRIALRQDRCEAEREHWFKKLNDACAASGDVFDQVAREAHSVLEKSCLQPEDPLKALPLASERVKRMRTDLDRLWHWAEDCFDGQRYCPAVLLYGEALEYARRLGDNARLGYCLHRFGEILRELRPGEPSLMASACFESAKACHATAGNRCGVAFADFREAEIQQDGKNWPAAQELFRKSLATFKCERQPIYVGYCHYRLAQVIRDGGDGESHWEHVSDAQDAWVSCGRPDLVARHIGGEFPSEF